MTQLVSYWNQPRALKQRSLTGHKVNCLQIDLGGIVSCYLFISMSPEYYSTISHLKLPNRRLLSVWIVFLLCIICFSTQKVVCYTFLSQELKRFPNLCLLWFFFINFAWCLANTFDLRAQIFLQPRDIFSHYSFDYCFSDLSFCDFSCLLKEFGLHRSYLFAH